jgi:hypothetical protein
MFDMLALCVFCVRDLNAINRQYCAGKTATVAKYNKTIVTL